jgi:hypothetical protein
MKCPSCGSPQTSRRRLGKDAGSAIGALLGASIAAASAMRGARIGVLLGGCIGPFGAAAGGISGAVISGICTGSLTSAIGGAIGSIVDRELLDGCECQACGRIFSHAEASSEAHEATGVAERQGTGFFGVTSATSADLHGGSDGARS